MLKAILTLSLSFFTMTVLAQDLIEKKDGTVITAKVIDSNKTRVRYKPWVNRRAKRIYTINIKDLSRINYQSGKIVNYDGNGANDNMPVELECQADAHNAELISSYSKYYRFSPKLKPTKKPARMALALFSASKESILSTADIEMYLERETVSGKPLSKGTPLNWYKIVLVNKSDKTLYIDRQQCLRTPSVGRSHVYCTGTAKADDSYELQRVLTIAPHSTVQLSRNDYLAGKGWAENVENFSFNCIPFFTAENPNDNIENDKFLDHVSDEFSLPFKSINMGEVKNYQEEDTPFSVDYEIVFSDKENFSTYSKLTATFFISQMVGIETKGEDYNGRVLIQTTRWMSGDKNNYPAKLVEENTEKTITGMVGVTGK